MRISLSVFTLVLTTVAWAGASEEVTGFRGVAWGTPFAQVESTVKAWTAEPRLPLECRTHGGGTTCHGWMTVGPVREASALVLFLAEQGFAEVALSASTAAFETFEAMLVERYGPPTRVLDTVITTTAGGSLPNRQLLWQTGIGQVALIRHSASDARRTSLVIQSAARVASVQATHQKQLREGARTGF